MGHYPIYGFDEHSTHIRSGISENDNPQAITFSPYDTHPILTIWPDWIEKYSFKILLSYTVVSHTFLSMTANGNIAQTFDVRIVVFHRPPALSGCPLEKARCAFEQCSPPLMDNRRVDAKSTGQFADRLLALQRFQRNLGLELRMILLPFRPLQFISC